jgi:hypothetical protein
MGGCGGRGFGTTRTTASSSSATTTTTTTTLRRFAERWKTITGTRNMTTVDRSGGGGTVIGGRHGGKGGTVIRTAAVAAAAVASQHWKINRTVGNLEGESTQGGQGGGQTITKTTTQSQTARDHGNTFFGLVCYLFFQGGWTKPMKNRVKNRVKTHTHTYTHTQQKNKKGRRET